MDNNGKIKIGEQEYDEQLVQKIIKNMISNHSLKFGGDFTIYSDGRTNSEAIVFNAIKERLQGELEYNPEIKKQLDSYNQNTSDYYAIDEIFYDKKEKRTKINILAGVEGETYEEDGEEYWYPDEEYDYGTIELSNELTRKIYLLVKQIDKRHQIEIDEYNTELQEILRTGLVKEDSKYFDVSRESDYRQIHGTFGDYEETYSYDTVFRSDSRWVGDVLSTKEAIRDFNIKRAMSLSKLNLQDKDKVENLMENYTNGNEGYAYRRYGKNGVDWLSVANAINVRMISENDFEISGENYRVRLKDSGDLVVTQNNEEVERVHIDMADNIMRRTQNGEMNLDGNEEPYVSSFKSGSYYAKPEGNGIVKPKNESLTVTQDGNVMLKDGTIIVKENETIAKLYEERLHETREAYESINQEAIRILEDSDGDVSIEDFEAFVQKSMDISGWKRWGDRGYYASGLFKGSDTQYVNSNDVLKTIAKVYNNVKAISQKDKERLADIITFQVSDIIHAGMYDSTRFEEYVEMTKDESIRHNEENLQGPVDENRFLEGVVTSARQKVELREQNERAQDLLQEYEQLAPTQEQPSLDNE